jgi:L-fuconolactonase
MSLSELGIVDTHCHLWDLEVARRTWITPELNQLFNSFRPADISRASAEVGVGRFVVIEGGTTPEENASIAQMAAESELIAGFAPWVDLESPGLGDELDEWQQDPKFCGVRMRFEGDPDDNVLAKPSIVDGLRTVAGKGIIFEFLVRTQHLAHVLEICASIPELKGVIEHLAKPDMVEGTERAEWEKHMRALARNTNLAAKLSLSPRAEREDDLLANPNQGWPVEAIRPYVQFLLEEFGTSRLMWGSDWPIALFTTDYAGIYGAMREAIGPISAEDELRLFRSNAIEFYGL